MMYGAIPVPISFFDFFGRPTAIGSSTLLAISRQFFLQCLLLLANSFTTLIAHEIRPSAQLITRRVNFENEALRIRFRFKDDLHG